MVKSCKSSSPSFFRSAPVRSFALVLGLAFPILGSAETYLTLGFSKHFTEGEDHCNTHPGVIREWRMGTVKTQLGIQQNSECAPSFVGAIAWQPLQYRRYSAGIAGLVLTNYEEGTIVTPAPVASYEEKNYGVDFTGWPGKILHIRWRFSFQ